MTMSENDSKGPGVRGVGANILRRKGFIKEKGFEFRVKLTVADPGF